MVTTLRVIDGEMFLPIDAATCAQLGWDADTLLEVKVEGGRLTVVPAAAAADASAGGCHAVRQDLDAVTQRLLTKNAELYRRLA